MGAQAILCDRTALVADVTRQSVGQGSSRSKPLQC